MAENLSDPFSWNNKMHFMDFLKSLFTCFIPKLRKTKKTTDPPKKTCQECRREKMHSITNFQLSWGYNRIRTRIFGRISHKYDKIVVIWCCGNFSPRASVTHKLYSYGDVSFIRERWSQPERYSDDRTWRGALVEYVHKNVATRCFYDIPVNLKFARASMLETVLSNLADCELLHPLCGQRAFKLLISRRTPLRTEEVTDLYKCLCSYGDVETFFVDNSNTGMSVVCEVTYQYLTQAYLAMLMTDGQCFSGGTLLATLENTPMSSQIICDAKECMILLSQCYFPN